MNLISKIDREVMAKRMYDQGRSSVGFIVANVVNCWVCRDQVPRVFVGDVSDAVLSVLEKSITETGDFQSAEVELPGGVKFLTEVEKHHDGPKLAVCTYVDRSSTMPVYRFWLDN